MKNLLQKIILLVIASLVCVAAFAQKPERPKFEDLRYEDLFTFKYGTSYARDPWTWAYTKEFADRFRMPAKWIEPELTGILAIAFRVTNAGQVDTCGLGGQENNCWPRQICQFDIYYDNRIKLPWIAEIEVRDNLMTGLSSRRFLYDVSTPEAKRYNYLRGTPNSHWSQIAADNLALPSLMSIGFSNESGDQRRYPKSFFYYDREFLPNIGLIGISAGSCPDYPFRKGVHWLDFFASPDAQAKSDKLPRNQLKAIGLVHEAFIPETYMKRINESLAAGAKAQQETIDRLIREFQQRK